MHDLLRALQQQVQTWNGLDWFLAASLAASALTAFATGLIRSLVSLVGACLGVFAATLYAGRCAYFLVEWVGSPRIARVVAFVLILLTTYLLVGLLGRLLRGICHAVGLGFFDRLAGAAFGAARAVLVLAALAVPLEPYLNDSVEARTSVLLPYLLRVSHGVSSVMPRNTKDILSIGEWQGRHVPLAAGRMD